MSFNLNDIVGRIAAATQWQNQVPVGQALSHQDIQRLPANIQPLAQLYNQNPQDPRVAHLDPAMFGYQADVTHPQHQTSQQIHGSFGAQPAQALRNIIQGGQFNPGFTPLQPSNLNYRQAPQAATFNPIQGNQRSPQQGISLY